MKLIYEIGVRVFYCFMYVASFIDPKAKAWIQGTNIKVETTDEPCIWIHSASLGEYNQAESLVSLLEKSGYKFVFTFFSPSGFEKVKTDYPKYYLRLDTQRNAKEFIARINPSLAIFVKSEYWFNHLSVLEANNIPLVFLNSLLHKDHYFFKWYGKWSLSKIRSTKFFYTNDKNTSELLNSNGILQNLNLGDTKVDQVIKAKQNKQELLKIPTNRKIILGASLEYGDREVSKLLLENYSEEFLLIIVPHEPSESTFDYYSGLSQHKLVKYSELSNTDAKVIYVDEFGILPALFQYAWVSYVGGGFDKGIHNILESCVESKPMIFGPKHHKFPEAQELINAKAAISINHPEEISDAIAYFEDQTNFDHAASACKEYIASHKGATQKIYDHMTQNFLNK